MNEEKKILVSLGEIKGKLDEGFRDIKERLTKVESTIKILPGMKQKLDNHLEHHQIKSDRWFSFISYVVGGVIIGLLIYLITLVH